MSLVDDNMLALVGITYQELHKRYMKMSNSKRKKRALLKKRPLVSVEKTP